MGGGVPLVGAPEALHDRDDGTLPGSDVRAASGGVRGGSERREGRHDRRRSDHGAPARPSGAVGRSRRRGPSGDREAHVPARRTRRRRRPDGMVRLLAPPSALRGRRGGVPRRPRARIRDGRRHAREVPRHGSRRHGADGRVVPHPLRRPGSRDVSLPARSRRGGLRLRRRPRLRAGRGRLVPHVDVGRGRSDGGLAPRPRRSAGAAGPRDRPHRRARRDPRGGAVRCARSSASSRTRRSIRRRSRRWASGS